MTETFNRNTKLHKNAMVTAVAMLHKHGASLAALRNATGFSADTVASHQTYLIGIKLAKPNPDQIPTLTDVGKKEAQEFEKDMDHQQAPEEATSSDKEEEGVWKAINKYIQNFITEWGMTTLPEMAEKAVTKAADKIVTKFAENYMNNTINDPVFIEALKVSIGANNARPPPETAPSMTAEEHINEAIRLLTDYFKYSHSKDKNEIETAVRCLRGDGIIKFDTTLKLVDWVLIQLQKKRSGRPAKTITDSINHLNDARKLLKTPSTASPVLTRKTA